MFAMSKTPQLSRIIKYAKVSPWLVQDIWRLDGDNMEQHKMTAFRQRYPVTVKRKGKVNIR
jgi:hypothetical protein